MFINKCCKILLVFFILFFANHTAKAQAGLCPSNLDFELGDFTGWSCEAGNVDVAGNLVLFPTPPIPGQHTIIDARTATIDPYGNFPQICPNGSGFSVKLGNSTGGRGAEGLSFTYTIPSTLTVFSMLFHYAVVLQDPNHPSYQQPRFRARITDQSTGSPIPCVDFDFVASASLPGFLPSPVGGGVVYKDWTPITINLTPFIGRTIKLEFITNDCTLGAHFGYAYVDVNTNCNGAIAGTTICQGDNSITLSAPFGFQSYQWFSDNTFSTLISTSQNLTLNPAPTVGTVMPVIVTPFTGFGCLDTLYATIGIAPKPVSDAGPDASICLLGTGVQIGGASTPGYMYNWTPANQVSNPLISNPVAWPQSSPVEYIVKTTDILTGCFSYDTTYVSIGFVDTAITVSGRKDYCFGESITTSLSLSNVVSNIQWYETNTAIPGANGISYTPTAPGDYWAEVSQGVCIDSTRIISIIVNPLPVANFTPDKDTSCISSSTFLFTNGSTVSDNTPLSHLWTFSDATTQTTADATKSFGLPGLYTAKLLTTTVAGCKDSLTRSVRVMPNGIPNFTFDSICTNRPVTFLNLSSENGSPLVSYSWEFNNGDPQYMVKNPPPVVYTTDGTVDVILKLKALGCEADSQTVIKKVQVNKAGQGIRYRTITVPEGSTQFIHARNLNGLSPVWKPQVQLSTYNTQYTQFFANGNDVDYRIEMTDIHTCVVVDSILMQILKKPGYYLPTAFTPNGDGLNDLAIPYLVRMKSLKSFSVFNRAGSLIFYTRKEGEGWDGKYKGVPQNNGVYVWMLEFVNNNDETITEKGTITIIR